LLAGPGRWQNSLLRFLTAQREKRTSLRDRFVWCALCAWTHLDDADVDAFAHLKKIRDDIAHGASSAPPAEAVVKIQEPAIRIQSGIP
jgi:hypothetical protein